MPYEILQRTNAGLTAQQNPIFAPEGALKKAENCVADREGIIGNRRGFSRYLNWNAEALGEFQGKTIVFDGSRIGCDNGTEIPLTYSGTYESPAIDRRMKFHEFGGALYFTSSHGVMKLDSLTGTIRRAGMSPGLDTQLELVAGTWFTNDTAVSYRPCWIRKDANKRVIRGSPGWRVTLANTSGVTKGVKLTTTIPRDAEVGDLLEIYRTDLSATAVESPGDEMYRICQIALTAGDLVTGTITWTDTFDSIFLGLPLETNATELTITQKADRPPWCLDFLEYRGYVFFLNVKREHRLDLQLLSTSGIKAFPAADPDSITIILGGTILTYTFATAEDIPNKRFKLETGLGSDALNLRATMESLCRVINRDAGNLLFNAFYVSEEDDPPGMIRIQCRDVGTDSFYVTATSGCASNFTPTIPTSGDSLSSDDLSAQHGFDWSRLEEPDAVPEANRKVLGSGSFALVGGRPLTSSLIFLKEDGVWRRTGTAEADFVDTPLDPSIHVVCPDAIDILDNQVYAVSLEGLIRATDSGVALVSWPVDIGLKKIFSYPNYQSITFGISYHSAFKFILWTQEFNTDTHAHIGWIWNHLTNRWTNWRKSCKCGIVLDMDDLLLLGHAEDGWVLRERKSWETTLADYMDESIPVTITAIGTTLDAEGHQVTYADLTYTYSEADLADGFILEQPSRFVSELIISVISLGGNSYRVVTDAILPTLQTGAAFVALPITTEIEWKPEIVENPAISKHFIESQIYLENEGALHFDVGFHTDIIPALKYYTRELEQPASGWGYGGWGTREWGDPDTQRAPILRTHIPTQYQRARSISQHLRHRYAKERLSILCQAFLLEQGTETTTVRDKS